MGRGADGSGGGGGCKTIDVPMNHHMGGREVLDIDRPIQPNCFAKQTQGSPYKAG